MWTAMPAIFPPRHLALAAVQPRADLQAQLTDAPDDRGSAPDRARRSVEGGEEAVPRRVDLAAAEPHELAADERVVALEELQPLAIAELGRPVREAHDVGEEHRRQHAVGLGLVPAAARPEVGQERLDGAVELGGPSVDREVPEARQLQELGLRHPLGQEARRVDRHELVLGTMEHQRGHVHGTEDVADVDPQLSLDPAPVLLLRAAPGVVGCPEGSRAGAAKDQRGRPLR
jgi:hypothetical protein